MLRKKPDEQRAAVGKILGVGRALGGRVVTNEDLERTLDTSDDWISGRTGIKQRHFRREGEDCATLADRSLAARLWNTPGSPART